MELSLPCLTKLRLADINTVASIYRAADLIGSTTALDQVAIHYDRLLSGEDMVDETLVLDATNELYQKLGRHSLSRIYLEYLNLEGFPDIINSERLTDLAILNCIYVASLNPKPEPPNLKLFSYIGYYEGAGVVSNILTNISPNTLQRLEYLCRYTEEEFEERGESDSATDTLFFDHFPLPYEVLKRQNQSLESIAIHEIMAGEWEWIPVHPYYMSGDSAPFDILDNLKELSIILRPGVTVSELKYLDLEDSDVRFDLPKLPIHSYFRLDLLALTYMIT